VIDMRIQNVDLPHYPEMKQALLSAFQLNDFRPGQAEVISSIISGRNTVVVMPTGAGKSLCFQLPATMLEGVTVVVSPLIALMQDQVDSLQKRNIAATFINSSISDTERFDRLKRLRNGEYKLVYVAPERFKSESFVSALSEAKVALFAIDEAHCISQWGHDFRPDYALLGQVRKRLRPPRTVALTATATPEVRDDIVKVLLMKDPQVSVSGFDRPNLFLEVAQVTGDVDKRLACENLAQEGSGVIYCNTRKQAETLHAHLVDADVNSVLYHAGLDDDARRDAQEKFMETDDSVAVATNAFGMGIDKPNIRFVAHAGIPRAVEAYYQEIGRAGRDGNASRAVLLFNHADVFTQERMIQSNFPPERMYSEVWNALRRGGGYDRGVHVLASHVGASEFEVSAILKYLERGKTISRGNRGEGRYTIAMIAGASDIQPRSPVARSLLAALKVSIQNNAPLTCELSLLSARSGLDEDGVKHALSLLERAGACSVQKPFVGRAISTLRDESWSELGLDMSPLKRQEQNQLLLLKRMTDYAYTKHCRRTFLLRYFGEDATYQTKCNGCDSCSGSRIKIGVKKQVTTKSYTTGPVVGQKPVLTSPQSTLVIEELRKMRREMAQEAGVPPFVIFSDATMFAIAHAMPTNKTEFLAVKGAGPVRWEKMGAQVIALCMACKTPAMVGAKSMRN
jgi:ATP-dependent DNA helicase RecQ